MKRWTPIVGGVSVGAAVGAAAYYLPPRGFAHATATGDQNAADRAAEVAFIFRDLIAPLGLLAVLILLFDLGSRDAPAFRPPGLAWANRRRVDLDA